MREAAIAAAAEAARAAGPPDPAVLYAEFLRLATSDGKYPPSYTQEEHFFREREANGGGWKLKNLYTDLDSARQGRVTLPLTDAGLFGREYDAAVDALRPTLTETFYPKRQPTVYDEEEAEEAAGMAFAASMMGALGLGDSLEATIALEVADATAW